jgi:hypothetical protein
MADFVGNWSIPSMSADTHPTNAGSIITEPGEGWGIDSVLSGYIIQNVQINKTVVTDITQDQKGAVVSELDYDTRWDGTMTVIGLNGATTDEAESATLPGLSAGMLNFPWANVMWKLDSVTYRGTYNDKKYFDLAFHRSRHFPAQ